jgi:hypothetical protein
MGEFALKIDKRIVAAGLTGLLALSACARPGEGINNGGVPSASAEASPSAAPQPSPVDGVYPEKVTSSAGAAVIGDTYGAGGTVATIPEGTDLGVSCWTMNESTGGPIIEIGDGPHIGEYIDPEAVGLADTYGDVLPNCAAATAGE